MEKNWMFIKFICWVKSVWFALIGRNWYETTWYKHIPQVDDSDEED